MSDPMTRSTGEAVVQATPILKSSDAAKPSPTVEVPYTDYEKQHLKPYAAEYFNLGETWDSSEGGFAKEIAIIEEYAQHKVRSGEVENSIDAVKNIIAKAEKMTNVPKEARQAERIGILSAYMKFLMESDNIKYNARKYGARF